MNDPTNTDWNRLVRKTRRRPLMFDPNAVQTAEGTKVRPRLLISPLMACATVGGFFTGLTFYLPELWAKAVTFVPGGFLLSVLIYRLFFRASFFIPADADEVIIRHGFFLFQTRLVLNRQSLVVDYQVGAETELYSSLRGMKIILLRHVETQEVAHLGYSMKSEEALRVFDALSRVLAEGSHNYTQAVITLADDSLLRVDRLPTWEAGKWRTYRNQWKVVAPNTVQIKRKAYGENRNVVDRAADVYPVRIESDDESIRLTYSNHDEKSVPHYDCVALQFCKEETEERAKTRFEINLIVDSFQENRLNLMSFDLRRGEAPDEPRRAAEELGELLGLELVDHL